jgi:HEAT repeat protein
LSTISISIFSEENALAPWVEKVVSTTPCIRHIRGLLPRIFSCIALSISISLFAGAAQKTKSSAYPIEEDIIVKKEQARKGTTLISEGNVASAIAQKEQILLSLALHDTRETYILLERLQHADKDFAANPETLAFLFDYLAEIQDIEGMRALFEKTQAKGPVILPQTTLEHIAWVNIGSASKAYHPKMRVEALLAAAESQDIHGMHILKTMITDPHQGVQSIALQLASNYSDEPIQKQAEAITRFDIPEAKLAAARLLALQKAPSAAKVLTSMLDDETLSEEDQVEIASFLAHLKEEVDIAWLRNAVVDPRPAIRVLAASSVLEAPTKDSLQCLLPLLNDPSANVKKYAFQTIGLWQPLIPEAFEQIATAWKTNLQSSSCDLAAVAAWAMLISPNTDVKKEASLWFEKALINMTKGQVLIATSHLIKAGEAGLPLASTLITKVQDPLSKINLAQYLLFHRRDIPLACDILRTSLSSTPTLLGEYSDGIFTWLGASPLPHHPAIPRLPESQDLFLRLQLLAIRCYSGQPIQRGEVEIMLNDRAWGISAAASSFLFQEFGHSLDEILTPLLSHETETVRIQAALLLTIISQSQQAATTLAEQYERASREGKEAIILGFGCLPASRTKAYLVPLLFDTSPVLRTRAAGALLSSMYR